MFERILVPLDGSALAELALPTASRLAHASHGTVILLRVVSPPVEYGSGSLHLNYTPTNILESVMEADLADARHYLEAVAKCTTLQGVHTQLEVRMGGATSLICSIADTLHVDIIVMSSHGRTGLKRWLLGSVARYVVRSSSMPVLILHELEASPVTDTASHPYVERPLRVLIPLDGSVVAKAALQPAAQVITALAAPGQGAIHLLRVVTHELQPDEARDATARKRVLQKAKTYLQSVTGHIRDGFTVPFNGTVTWSVVLDSDPAAAIIRVAENGEDAEGAGAFGGCDIIALATHGRRGLQRWTMASVAEQVLSGTRLPVLVVRPHNTVTAVSPVGTQVKRTDSAQV
ncbi:MAG TPA: universal stress protein [Ktedonobacteraceae bacterium]|nr:universal stress protein [Ktedonobacteraceae bacterium]